MKYVQLTPEFVRQHNELLQELEERKTSSGPGQDRETQELRSEIARLTVEVEQLESALAAIESDKGQSQNEQEEIKGLKSQLEALQQDSEPLQKTVKNAKSKIKATEAELLKVRLERDTSLKEVQTLNAALQRAILELKKTNSQPPVTPPPAVVTRSGSALRAEFQRLKKELQQEERELRGYDSLFQNCEDEVLSEVVDLMTGESEKKRLRAVLAKKIKYGNK